MRVVQPASVGHPHHMMGLNYFIMSDGGGSTEMRRLVELVELAATARRV